MRWKKTSITGFAFILWPEKMEDRGLRFGKWVNWATSLSKKSSSKRRSIKKWNQKEEESSVISPGDISESREFIISLAKPKPSILERIHRIFESFTRAYEIKDLPYFSTSARNSYRRVILGDEESRVMKTTSRQLFKIF